GIVGKQHFEFFEHGSSLVLPHLQRGRQPDDHHAFLVAVAKPEAGRSRPTPSRIRPRCRAVSPPSASPNCRGSPPPYPPSGRASRLFRSPPRERRSASPSPTPSRRR